MKHYIEIVKRDTGKVEERIPIPEGWAADKVKKGLNESLKDDYYARVVAEEDADG